MVMCWGQRRAERLRRCVRTRRSSALPPFAAPRVSQFAVSAGELLVAFDKARPPARAISPPLLCSLQGGGRDAHRPHPRLHPWPLAPAPMPAPAPAPALASARALVPMLAPEPPSCSPRCAPPSCAGECDVHSRVCGPQCCRVHRLRPQKVRGELDRHQRRPAASSLEPEVQRRALHRRLPRDAPHVLRVDGPALRRDGSGAKRRAAPRALARTRRRRKRTLFLIAEPRSAWRTSRPRSTVVEVPTTARRRPSDGVAPPRPRRRRRQRRGVEALPTWLAPAHPPPPPCTARERAAVARGRKPPRPELAPRRCPRCSRLRRRSPAPTAAPLAR